MVHSSTTLFSCVGCFDPAFLRCISFFLPSLKTWIVCTLGGHAPNPREKRSSEVQTQRIRLWCQRFLRCLPVVRVSGSFRKQLSEDLAINRQVSVQARCCTRRCGTCIQQRSGCSHGERLRRRLLFDRGFVFCLKSNISNAFIHVWFGLVVGSCCYEL